MANFGTYGNLNDYLSGLSGGDLPADMPDWLKQQFFKTQGNGSAGENPVANATQWSYLHNVKDQQGRDVVQIGDSTNGLIDPSKKWEDPVLGTVTEASNFKEDKSGWLNPAVGIGLVLGAGGLGNLLMGSLGGDAAAAYPGMSGPGAGDTSTFAHYLNPELSGGPGYSLAEGVPPMAGPGSFDTPPPLPTDSYVMQGGVPPMHGPGAFDANASAGVFSSTGEPLYNSPGFFDRASQLLNNLPNALPALSTALKPKAPATSGMPSMASLAGAGAGNRAAPPTGRAQVAEINPLAKARAREHVKTLADYLRGGP